MINFIMYTSLSTEIINSIPQQLCQPPTIVSSDRVSDTMILGIERAVFCKFDVVMTVTTSHFLTFL